MEHNKPQNPQAFPRPFSEDRTGGDFPEHFAKQDGMTLRDYFAAKAMQGIICTNEFAPSNLAKDFPERASVKSYEIADAMLKERSK